MAILFSGGGRRAGDRPGKRCGLTMGNEAAAPGLGAPRRADQKKPSLSGL